MQEKSETKLYAKDSLRVIFGLIKRFKRDIIVLSAIAIVSAIGNALTPFITGRLFDSITLNNIELDTTWLLLGTWVFIQLIAGWADWKIGIDSWRLGFLARSDYAVKAYSTLLHLPLGFHKSHKLTETDSKINRGSYSIETIFGRIMLDLAPQFFAIVISLYIVFTINVPLSFLLIGGVTIYVLIAYRNVSKTGNMMDAGYDAWNDSFGYAGDLLQNVTTIKQAATEEYETKKLYEKFNTKLVAIWLGLEALWNNLRYYQRIIILLCQIVIFVYSILLISQGAMTIGELIAFNAYSAMMFGPFVILMNNWQIVQNGLINIGKTEKVLQLPAEIYEPKESSQNAVVSGEIVFKDVCFYYDEDKPVLQDINFSVKPGDVVALVGESGVGKSTLIDLISGYHFPRTGSVVVDGTPIQKMSLTALRRNIAIVPQEVVLFNDTIEYNISYGNFDTTRHEREIAAKKAHALDFINKFPGKWEQLVGERGVKLSVGQKQRIAIARAILRNPKILILDEPTSALDAGSENIITQSLNELMQGKTTFVIAHRLSTVRKADMILVFKDGKIIEKGKHAELITIPNGEYRRLHELQIGLHE